MGKRQKLVLIYQLHSTTTCRTKEHCYHRYRHHLQHNLSHTNMTSTVLAASDCVGRSPYTDTVHPTWMITSAPFQDSCVYGGVASTEGGLPSFGKTAAGATQLSERKEGVGVDGPAALWV